MSPVTRYFALLAAPLLSACSPMYVMPAGTAQVATVRIAFSGGSKMYPESVWVRPDPNCSELAAYFAIGPKTNEGLGTMLANSQVRQEETQRLPANVPVGLAYIRTLERLHTKVVVILKPDAHYLLASPSPNELYVVEESTREPATYLFHDHFHRLKKCN
jgi:hypothetical protein